MNDKDFRETFEELSRIGTNFYKAEDYELSDKALKIDDDTIASSSSIFSTVPWIATKLGYSGALIAELPDGTHLATDATGKMLGAALSDETNKLVAQARFSSLQPKGADIISMVFAVMSFVTGQYYMHVNSMDMGQANGVLKNLEGHIEAEKYSELCQENETLKNIAEDYKFIVRDENRMKNSRLVVEDIVNKTSQNNEYYKRQIESFTERFKDAGKKDMNTQEKLTNINSLAYKTIFNLYNHGIANFMFMLLYNIRSKEEILVRKERLEKKWNEATQLVDKVYHDIEDFTSTEAFERIIKQESLDVMGTGLRLALIPFPLNLIVDKNVKDTGATIERKKYADAMEKSLDNIKKFKCEVSPIPMIDNYVSALEQRKILICKDGNYYLDVIDQFDNLGCEIIPLEALA